MRGKNTERYNTGYSVIKMEEIRKWLIILVKVDAPLTGEAEKKKNHMDVDRTLSLGTAVGRSLILLRLCS